MEVPKVEPGTVLPGDESRPRVKNIYLRGHCVFCLRRLKDVEITMDGRTFESETGNLTEVPVADLPQSIVSSVNWVWDALKMEQEEDGDIFGVRSGPGVGTKFNGVPKLCEQCGGKVLGVDKLLSWVRREISELRRLLTRCKEQGSCRQFVRTLYNLGLDDGVVADTMEFLGEFRSRIDGVPKDDQSMQGDVGEDVEDEKDFVSCEVTSSSMAKDPEFLGDFQSRIEPEVESEQEVVGSEEDEDPSIPFIPCTSESVKTHDPLAIDDSSTDEFEDGTSAEEDDDKDEDYIPSKKRAKFDKTTFNKPLRGQQQQKKPSPKQQKLSTDQIEDAFQEEFYIKEEEEEDYFESEDESSAPNSPKQPKKINKELQKKVRISKFHKDIICEFCRIKVPQIELHEHIKGHVGQEYIDMVRCPDPQCWFACVTQNQLCRYFKKRALCIKNVVGGLQAFKRKQRTCTVCGFTGNSLTILNNHLLQEHEIPEKNFPCPISGCGIKFTVKQSVVLHLGQHDVQRQVDTQPCLECEDKKQIKLEEMEAHLKEVHGAEQVVSCVKCPFLFSSREQLVNHMYQHRHWNIARKHSNNGNIITLVRSDVQAELKEACKRHSIPYIQAPFESDPQIKYLVENKFADLVISEDSDYVLYGCKEIFFKMDHNFNGDYYEHANFEKSFGLPYWAESFRAICILTGCDYLPGGLYGFGIDAAKKLYPKLGPNFDYDRVKLLFVMFAFKGPYSRLMESGPKPLRNETYTNRKLFTS